MSIKMVLNSFVAIGMSIGLSVPATSVAAGVPESDEPIKFMIADWTSIGLQA